MSGIGVNLRVTGHCSQGGRKYMEDTFSVAYQQTEDLKDLEYAYFGIFDGHGGPEAALYAKDHLIDAIVSQSCFWSENDEDVLRAIHDGYIQTHYAMWKHHETWPRTATGLPSTSGTTATVAFIKKGKLYLGHVGDSCIVLGYQEEGNKAWKARPLTIDHKPEARVEIRRIMDCGGKVVTKSGVPRVVWNRPRLGHKGPVRRSTPIDEIPFLAVARALGDFWSYNSASNKFVVSPEPDVSVHPVDVDSFRCLILGTDGLWNILSPAMAVTIVQATENHNKKQVVYPPDQFVMQYNKDWINPSKMLVDKAVHRWALAKQRADNTSVVTLMLDPPGPPKPQFLVNQKQLMYSKSDEQSSEQESFCSSFDSKLHTSAPDPSATSGVAIFTRYPNMGMNSTLPVNKFSNSVSLNDSSSGSPSCSVFSDSKSEADESIQINEISSSAPDNMDLSIVNIEQTPIPSSSCDKRKRVETTPLGNSYNFRMKQKSRLPEKEDERNSDVENSEQWSQRWSEIPSSSSQCSVKKSKSKRRRFSFEQNRDWRCSTISLPSTPLGRTSTKPSRSASTSTNSLLFTDKHLNKRIVQETTRILRSDTIANTPIRTLRSRNIDLSAVMKPKNDDLKSTRFSIKSCVQRPLSPRAKCVRSPADCSVSKKLTRMSSFGESSMMTRRSAAKRTIK